MLCSQVWAPCQMTDCKQPPLAAGVPEKLWVLQCQAGRCRLPSFDTCKPATVLWILAVSPACQPAPSCGDTVPRLLPEPVIVWLYDNV